MNKVISGLLVLVGIIHILPVSGVLGVERLAMLYGVTLNDPDLEILMRHRAVLFGLLGTFFMYAAFTPTYQPLAFIAGFVSVIAFFLIAGSVAEYNDAIRKVIFADVVALIALVWATFFYLRKKRD